MKCKNCGTELTGRKTAFCSNKCRSSLRYKQQQQTIADTKQQTQIMDSVKKNPDTKETRPTLEGQEAGNTICQPEDSANTVTPVPACNTQDNNNTVSTDKVETKHADIHIIEQPDLTQLDVSAQKPTGQRTPATAAMTAQELLQRVQPCQEWIALPEYCEIIYRLLTQTVEQLEAAGQPVPAWKKAEAA